MFNNLVNRSVFTLLTLTILFYPLVFKWGFNDKIFVHPFEIFMAILWVLIFTKIYIDTQFRRWFLNNWIVRLYFLLIGIFILASFYGTLVGGNFDLNEFLRALKYGIYFSIYPATFGVVSYVKESYLPLIWKWIIYLSVIPAVYSLTRIVLFILSGGELNRWLYDNDRRSLGFFGQYVNTDGIHLTASGAHGVYGIFVSLILLAVFILLLTKNRQVPINKLLVIATINLAALVFTFARMGWIILLIGANLIVWRKLGINIWLIFFSSTVSLILILAGIFNTSELVIKFTETVNLGSEGLQFDASSAGRVAGWADSFRLVFSSIPFFLFGVGYSQYNLLLLTEGKLRIIHSAFLDTWVRAGLPALVALSILWWKIWQVIREGYKNNLMGFNRDLLILLEAFFIPFLINNLISGGEFFSDALMVYWWFLIGSVVAFNYKHLRKNENS